MNCQECKHLQVLQSEAGFYIGAQLDRGPYCRVSKYYGSEKLAKYELKMKLFQLRDCVEINAIMDGLLPCEVNI